jgi:hypothetical protein
LVRNAPVSILVEGLEDAGRIGDPLRGLKLLPPSRDSVKRIESSSPDPLANWRHAM